MKISITASIRNIRFTMTASLSQSRRATRSLSRAAGFDPFWIDAATAIGRARGMPLPDARETGANAVITVSS